MRGESGMTNKHTEDDMSDTNTPMLPDLDTAINVIAGNVDYDCFMNKLASLGYSPATPDEAQELYNLGWKLDEASQQPAVKAASAGPFAQASADLDRVLAPNTKVASAHNEALEKAYAYAHQPEIYLSTLAIKTAEAEAMERNAQ